MVAWTRRLTKRITDRRRERVLAAKVASQESGVSKLKRGAAVRVDPIVRPRLAVGRLHGEPDNLKAEAGNCLIDLSSRTDEKARYTEIKTPGINDQNAERMPCHPYWSLGMSAINVMIAPMKIAATRLQHMTNPLKTIMQARRGM
jgi:hypothetical protein